MAIQRKSVKIPGLSPITAIPTGSVIGNRFFSSTIGGVDVATGWMGDSPERQFELAFQNLQDLMERIGGSLDNVGLLTAFVKNHELRGILEQSWHQVFPDADDCPVRKVTVIDLPGQDLIQLHAVGVLGERRKLVAVPGIQHRNRKLPLATRLGDMVYSSVIGGQDPKTGANCHGATAQMTQTLVNMQALMENTGGSLEDIVHAWVYLKEYDHWDISFTDWVKAFPGKNNLPARKTITPRTAVYELLGDTEVQVQFIADLGGGRKNFEVEGFIAHRDPVPLGCKVGMMFCSSGIPGTPGEGMAEQADYAFQNMKALIETAGGTTDNIGQITILTTEFGHEAILERVWQKMFPDPLCSPACHVMKWGTSGNTMFQVHFTAVL
jgi:enamine deaminase RidA (YjgF/YER057c/UK114 family)